MNIKKTADMAYHIFAGEESTTMLYRYGILKKDADAGNDGLCRENEGKIEFDGAKRKLVVEYGRKEKGFFIRIKLSEEERLYGLGDVTRDNVMVRGTRAVMKKHNVTAYGPMPVIMSTDGWGFVLNSTYESVFDCAASENDTFEVTATDGEIDFYIFGGNSLKNVLGHITSVTGRAEMLPKFAYGLTFVENEWIDARGLLWDIKTLREKGFPCDIIGLEPNWMDKRYDYTTDKKWNYKMSPFSPWQNERSSDACTVFYPMREMGMQLSLWLCTEYDYFYYEDKTEEKNIAAEYGEDAVFVDEHFLGDIRMDGITKRDEAWFEHLKKFVDNGAAAFKLDGANQIEEHSDRLWGGKYTDKEVNNILPVILEKQMTNGFREYTGRRLMLYSSGAYLGTQQFAATWAGDTGSGPRTAVSLMNYAMCGHSNTSCDVEVADVHSIHFGFLSPWAQYFCWAQWIYPWFLDEEKEEMIRFYANLRSSLVPYVYTMAYTAYSTGIPIMRPLPLMYEDDPRFYNIKNAYMLGDKLYVGIFDMKLSLPEGEWVDYWNNDVYEGDIEYDIPKGKSGALFAKRGSVFVTMRPQKYVMEKEHDYIIKVYPGGDDTFTLYEDDGFTYDYCEGKCAKTLIEMTESDNDSFMLTIRKREGDYSGREDNGHDITRNSIPEIKPLAPVGDITVEINARILSGVYINGNAVEFENDEKSKKASFILPKELHEQGDVTYKILLR